MIARISCGLDQFIYDRLRCREIRIAHTKVDDILAAPPGLHLVLGDDGKNVGWKFFNQWESIVHNSFGRVKLTLQG